LFSEERTIKQLDEINCPKELQIDPFSNQSFIFEPSVNSDKKSYVLLSVGPDCVRNLTAGHNIVVYDPTNGIYSEGDIAATDTKVMFRDLKLGESYGTSHPNR